jgi:hypothetical protein
MEEQARKNRSGTPKSAPSGPKRQRSGGLEEGMWTARQYEKYDAYKRQQREAREASMWQGAATASRPPPKLEFKQRLDTTGPAPHQLMVETLVAMGFAREQAEGATKATNGRSVEDAAAFLLNGVANAESRRNRRGGTGSGR